MAYLDHAATTPLLPAARDAWVAQAARLGNASSLHASGRGARRVVEESRESIAADLGVDPIEVVLTAGGTESDNLAVKGLFWARRRQDPRRRVVLASAVEHHAVLDPVRWLGAHEGADVRLLPVDGQGRVDPAAVEDELARAPGDIALCTLMWANNEVGTVQPVPEVAALCAAAGVPLHTDAVQALGQVPVTARLPGLAALTASGHKLGAPVGSGVLVLDRDQEPVPLLHGGGQEREVRSGTPDAAGAAALAVAIRVATAERAAHAARVQALRDDLLAGVLSAVPEAVVSGPWSPGEDVDRPSRLPGNAHITIPGCEGDALIMLLDAAGVECSTGSACTSGVPAPSHVLLAMGIGEQQARGSLRFTLGRTSSADDVDALLSALPAAVARARGAGLVRLARSG